MKLAAWLDKHWVTVPDPDRPGRSRTRQQFAARIRVTPSMLSQYCSDDPPWPGAGPMEAIERETGGAVSGRDFYKMEAAE